MKITAKLAIASAAAAALLLSACGSNSLGGGGSTPAPTESVAVDSALNAKLPEAIRTSGKLRIGTDASYAPNQYTEGNNIVGSEIDLFDHLAKKLGVTAEFENAQFATIIPGVTSSKYDLGVSSFTINSDRLKQALMVSYYSAGTLWATQAGNPKGVDVANPCGKTVAVQKATVQDLDDLPARQKKCGNNPMTIQEYTGQDTATAAVATGKADAMLADSPVTAYAVAQSGGKLQALGEIYEAAPYGVVVAKNNPQLAQVVAEGLTAMKADGSYDAILKQWGTDAGSVSTFEVKQ